MIHEQSGLAFVEVFVDASIEVCEKRDPKGLYKKARSGGLTGFLILFRYFFLSNIGFTGIDDEYQKPLCPDIHIKSDLSVKESVELILAYLSVNKLIN